MTWRPLPSSTPGVARGFKYDNGQVHIGTWQDCAAIVEHNKAMQNRDRRTSHRATHEGPVAKIPLVVIEQWGHELGFPVDALPPTERRAFITRKLRDGDWKYLKSTSEAL